METIKTAEALAQLKEQQDGLLVLFGGTNCQVCHSIRPKLVELVNAQYPRLKMVYVDCHVTQDLCAQETVLSLPTLQVFFGGQKFIEEVRTFSLQKVMTDIARPYQMMFD